MRRIAICVVMMLITLGFPAMADGSAYIVNTNAITALVDAEGNALLQNDDIDSIFAVREDALYAAGHRGDYRLYTAGGAPLGGTHFAMIEDAGDVLIFRQGEHYGAMDSEGNTVISPVWTQLVYNGSDGYLALNDDLLNDTPDEIIYIAPDKTETHTGLFTLGRLYAFEEGCTRYVTVEGDYGLLDATGARISDITYSWIGPFVDGSAVVITDSGYGLLDYSGNWTVKPDYAWMQRGNNMIAAGTDEAVDVFDTKGHLLYSVSPAALTASLIGSHLALGSSDAARLYDAQGQCWYEASPTTLFFPGVDGQLIASDGPWGAAAQWLVDPIRGSLEGRYQRLLPLCPDRYAYMTMQGVEYYSDDLESLQISWDYSSVRYGLIDGSGETLLPAEYLEIRALKDDRLLLRTPDSIVFADLEGNALRSWPVTTTRTTASADE